MWATKRRNRYLWSCLLIVSVVACVSVVYLYAVHTDLLAVGKRVSGVKAAIAEKLTEEKCNPVCGSKECTFQANMILRRMNARVDPCNDFNAFLCGEFKERFGPGDRGSGMYEAKEKMLHKLKDILENIQAEPESASAKMKVMYDSCMSYGSDLQAVPTAQEFLNSQGILGWPKLDQDFKFPKHLSTILGNLIASGDFQVLSFGLAKNSSKLHSDKKILSVAYIIRLEAVIELPKEAGVRILKYFDLESEEINQIMDDHEAVKSCILKLKEDFPDCEENCTDIYLNCSREMDPEWEYLCDIMQAFIVASNFSDDISDLLLIEGSRDRFIKRYIAVLSSFTDRSVANFLAMNFFWQNLRELNFYFRLTKQKYFEVNWKQPMVPVDKWMDKWKYCILWIGEYMTLPLEHEYFRHHLTQPVIEEILDLYYEYRSEVGDMIAEQNWIPKPERSLIEDAIRNVTNNLILLKEMLPSETYVDEYFKSFHPTPKNFFHNVLQFKKVTSSLFAMNHYLYWGIYGTDFDVQAGSGEDIIMLHYGLFFPPTYLRGLERQINRAPFAMIMGHELGHVFIFAMFDVAENINETRQSFQERKDCVENQFSKFKFDILDENLNGSQYLIENLSDSLYTVLLDRVIEKYVSNKEEILLPGLPYTTAQLLYMSTHQLWCSKSNLKQDMYYKTEDAHAPDSSRVIGAMQNSRGYSEAFHCPEGSYMNTAIKCSLLDYI